MEYKAVYYPFDQHPDADSCWSLSAGPDGRIYAAACCEHIPGDRVVLTRYDDANDAIEYLFDLDEMVDDPRDSGRATQCKIHYSFAPSAHDGALYMATHLSGPPIDLPAYSPWNFWHDEERCFRGAALLAFDTTTDRVLWWDTLFPKEGCRCLLLDEERGLLYAIGYPRDHLFVYDIAARKRRDLGRIGSINSQALFLDASHRVWTASDYGRLVRYDPATDRIETSPEVLPHEPGLQNGWHSVFYDIAPAPGAPCVYAVTWTGSSQLMRIWPDEGAWGRVEDLGRTTQAPDPTLPANFYQDHSGGLVFAGDGCLYYAASRWHDPVRNPLPEEDRKHQRGVVWRYNPRTGERDAVALLERPNCDSHYISRGAADRNGNLFFGHVGPKPVGFFKVTLPPERRKKNAHLPLRPWG